MRITHRQLEAFIQFMEAGTVTAAAEKMFVSQPAMSKILSGLEVDLGLTLFQRVRKRLVPTEEARLVYEEARRLLASVANIERFADDLRNFRSGELRIVSAASIGHTIVADVIVSVLRQNSAVSASLDVSSSVASDILNQNVDLGFSVTQFQHPSLVTTPLLHAQAVCAVPKDHRLAGRAVVGPKDLEGEEFVSFTRNSRVRHLTDALFEQHGVIRTMRTEVFSSAEANVLVSRGLGVALVEPLGVQRWRELGVVPIPFAPAIEFTFNLVRRRDREMTRLAAHFVDELNAELRRLAGGSSPLAGLIRLRDARA